MLRYWYKKSPRRFLWNGCMIDFFIYWRFLFVFLFVSIYEVIKKNINVEAPVSAWGAEIKRPMASPGSLTESFKKWQRKSSHLVIRWNI